MIFNQFLFYLFPVIYVSKDRFLGGLVGRVFILNLVFYQSVCLGFLDLYIHGVPHHLVFRARSR